MQHDIFISFTSKNKEIVKDVKDYLEAGTDSIKCWWSEGNIEAAETHEKIVPENLSQSAMVLLFASEESKGSTWVLNECAQAISMKIPVFPLNIDPNYGPENWNYTLGSIQHFNGERLFAGKKEKQECLKELKEAIKAKLSKIHESPYYIAHVEEIIAEEERQYQSKLQAEKEAQEAQNLRDKLEKKKIKDLEKQIVAEDRKKMKNNVIKTVYGDAYGVETEEAIRKRRKRVKVLSVIALIVLAGLYIGYLKVNAIMHTIDLDGFYTVEFEGYEGYGFAKVNFLEDKFNEAYSKKVSPARKKGVDASELLNVTATVDRPSALSNGDSVKLTIEADKGAFKKEYGYNLVFEPAIEMEVSGLKETSEIDPFENIEVSFSGFNCLGEAIIEKKSEKGILSEIHYKALNSGSLSNGDKVTINVCDEAGEDIAKKLAEENGVVLTESSRDYMVSGLDEQEAFDAFALLDVKFEGFEGQGKMVFEENGKLPETLYFSTDYNGEDLSIGDTITFELCTDSGMSVEDKCLLDLKICPKEYSRTYTVTGLMHYINSIEDINDETVEAIKAQAMDYMTECNNSKYEGSVLGSEYIGAYMLKSKEPVEDEGYKIDNELFFTFVSQLSVHGIEHHFYWGLIYENVSCNDEGENSINPLDFKDIYKVCRIEGMPFWGYEELSDLRAYEMDLNASDYYITTTIEE